MNAVSIGHRAARRTTAIALRAIKIPRVPDPEFPQRNEEVLKILLERLEQVSAKLNVAVGGLAEGDADEIAEGSALIARECAAQLTNVECRLGDWTDGRLSRLEMEGFDVDHIEDVVAEEAASIAAPIAASTNAEHAAIDSHFLAAARMLRIGVVAFAADQEPNDDDTLEIVNAAKERVLAGLDMASELMNYDPERAFDALDVLAVLEAAISYADIRDTGKTISPIRGTMKAAADLLTGPSNAAALVLAAIKEIERLLEEAKDGNDERSYREVLDELISAHQRLDEA